MDMGSPFGIFDTNDARNHFMRMDDDGNHVPHQLQPDGDFTVAHVIHWSPGSLTKAQLIECLEYLVSQPQDQAEIPPRPALEGFHPMRME